MKKIFSVILTLLFIQQLPAQEAVLLDDLNIHSFNGDFSHYDQGTSIFCAQISELAYWDQTKLVSFFKKLNSKYSNDRFQFKLINDRIGAHHNQALIVGNRKFIIVAFRGTEPTVFKDWFSDVKYWHYENTDKTDPMIADIPPGHGGFRTATRRLIMEKDLIGAIKTMIHEYASGMDETEFPVYLTGHSLGAAISQMFIEPLVKGTLKFKGAYHFAPPLAVGCSVNAEMKNKYGSIVYDIVNYKDYVPRAGRNDVAHYGQFFRICNNGLIFKEKETYVKFSVKEYLSEFKLHSLAAHVKAIRDDRNSYEAISQRSSGSAVPCMGPSIQPQTICAD